MKKQIIGIFQGEESNIDFSGFSGDDCHSEENALRAFLARLGIETEATDEQNKDRTVKVPEGPIRNRIRE